MDTNFHRTQNGFVIPSRSTRSAPLRARLSLRRASVEESMIFKRKGNSERSFGCAALHFAPLNMTRQVT